MNFIKGSGVWLYEANGDAYLDGISGTFNLPLGYDHPHVLAAVQSQLLKFSHFEFRPRIRTPGACDSTTVGTCSPWDRRMLAARSDRIDCDRVCSEDGSKSDGSGWCSVVFSCTSWANILHLADIWSVVSQRVFSRYGIECRHPDPDAVLLPLLL